MVNSGMAMNQDLPKFNDDIDCNLLKDDPSAQAVAVATDPTENI
jgi:hypothetical protein